MRRRNFHGLRFQKRIKVFPGRHLNVSLSRIGVSAGGRGPRRTDHARTELRECWNSWSRLECQAVRAGWRTSLQQHSAPRMSVWPLVMAVVMLVMLLLAAMR